MRLLGGNSYELLAAVAGFDAKTLGGALDRLADAGLVFQQGSLPNASFLFKHALVQEAAYATLLRGPRQNLHARIAIALEHVLSDGRTGPTCWRSPSIDGNHPQTVTVNGMAGLPNEGWSAGSFRGRRSMRGPRHRTY